MARARVVVTAPRAPCGNRARRLGALALFVPVEVAAVPVGRPSLTLSPASGPPGTTVTLHGYVPGLTKAPPPYTGITVCLGSCGLGFTEQSPAVRFLGNGRFTAPFMLPKAPVLTASGPLPLVNGRYRVGFTCIGPGQEGRKTDRNLTRNMLHFIFMQVASGPSMKCRSRT